MSFSDTQCRWKIDTHDPNRVIHFKMVDFVIEQSATCNKDFVELKDGKIHIISLISIEK